VEKWELPQHGGKPAAVLLEISARVPFHESITKTLELKSRLEQNGISLLSTGATKTQIVLNHFL
jgi:hypothetical protein